MSVGPTAYLLFQKWLRHDPGDPDWAGRDRFVLSMGHSSLTLYIQLFLSGYGLELCDLEALFLGDFATQALDQWARWYGGTHGRKHQAAWRGAAHCSRWCTSRTWPRPWPSTRLSAGVVRQGSRDGYRVLTGIGGGEIGLLAHPPSPAQNEGTVELNSRAVG